MGETLPKIDELYAYIIADKDENDEGVIGMRMPNGTWTPLVGADLARMESLRPVAQKTAEVTGKPVKFVKFEKRTDVETITPPVEIPIT